jgi:hypothetical protein
MSRQPIHNNRSDLDKSVYHKASNAASVRSPVLLIFNAFDQSFGWPGNSGSESRHTHKPIGGLAH